MTGAVPHGAALRTSARARRREWIGLAVIAIPCLLYAMDLTVLNLAVPAISAAASVGVAVLAAVQLRGGGGRGSVAAW